MLYKRKLFNLVISLVISLGFLLSVTGVKAAAPGECLGGTGFSGALPKSCFVNSTGTVCRTVTTTESCTCDMATCSCTVSGGVSCVFTGGGVFWTCSVTGANCANTNCSTTYANNTCLGTWKSGDCTAIPESAPRSYSCQTQPLPNAPGGNTNPPPANNAVPTVTNTPAPVVPASALATPTPAIIGTIYNDPNNLSVVSGDRCVTTDPAPAEISLAYANIEAVSSTNTTHADLLGANYKIVAGLTTGDTYTVSLALPTPAAGDLNSYICSCPVGGNDYLCSYSSVAANDTVNFFVRSNSMATSWWQTYGGNVYAKNEIQTQIPVGTCTDAGTAVCQSALIVSTGGDNSAGFAVLGNNGSLKTSTDGSDAYVQSNNSRSNSIGAYAVGVDPGQENYDYFRSNAGNQTASLLSLAEIKTDISALADNTAKFYAYAGGGDLVIDKDSASVPISLSGNKRITIFVPGNLIFTNTSGSASPQLTNVPIGSFLMFVVQGNILVDNTVGYTNAKTNPTTAQPNLTGVFMANGQIMIQNDGDTTIADRKFIGAGTFVGWGGAGSLNTNGIDLQRSFQDAAGLTNNATNPTEVFIYRPDFLANFPVELKTAHYNWSEIAPQK